MFFAPSPFSRDDLANGTWHSIDACDPLQHNGNTGSTIFIKVPRGAQLFKSAPFWLQESKVGITRFSNGDNSHANDKVGWAYNVTKHIAQGADYHNSLIEFLEKYVNTFQHGTLTVWQNGTMSGHTVPFNIFFVRK
jgi:hypothetical protein